MRRLAALSLFALLPINAAFAEAVSVPVHAVSETGVGAGIGSISLTESEKGLVLTPKLADLSPGEHGFHIHENPNCAPAEKEGKMTAAQAAGGHFDPAKTGKHEGPAGHGHRGDLPALTVSADGTATTAVTIPHLTLSEVAHRAIVIHEGGDNYSDDPKPLGGGGKRIACGVIP